MSMWRPIKGQQPKACIILKAVTVECYFTVTFYTQLPAGIHYIMHRMEAKSLYYSRKSRVNFTLFIEKNMRSSTEHRFIGNHQTRR